MFERGQKVSFAFWLFSVFFPAPPPPTEMSPFFQGSCSSNKQVSYLPISKILLSTYHWPPLSWAWTWSLWGCLQFQNINESMSVCVCVCVCVCDLKGELLSMGMLTVSKHQWINEWVCVCVCVCVCEIWRENYSPGHVFTEYEYPRIASNLLHVCSNLYSVNLYPTFASWSYSSDGILPTEKFSLPFM